MNPAARRAPLALAAILTLLPVLGVLPEAARGDVIWDWSFAGSEQGRFRTDGSLAGGVAPAGTYTVLDFEVTGSAFAPLGSIGAGDYDEGAQPGNGFLWDGSAPTQFFRDGGLATNGSNFYSTLTDHRFTFYIDEGPGAFLTFGEGGLLAQGPLSLFGSAAAEGGYYERVQRFHDDVASDMARALDRLVESDGAPGDLLALLDEIDDDRELAAALSGISPVRLETSRSNLSGAFHFHERLSHYLREAQDDEGRHASLGGALRAAAPAALAAVRGALRGDPFRGGAAPAAAPEELPDVAAAAGAGHWHAFAETLGGYGTEDAHGGRVAQRWTSGGFLGGADYALDGGWVTGLAGGYSFSDARDRGGDADGDIRTTRFGPYLSFARSGFSLDAGLSAGLHWIDQGRSTLAGSTRSDYEAWDVASRGTVRFDWERGPFRFGPVSTLHAVRLEEDGFSESGGLAPLHVDSSDSDSLSSTVGGHVAWRAPGSEWDATVDAEVGWAHEFMDDSQKLGARFVGVPGSDFRIGMPAADRNGLRMSVGAQLGLGERWSARLGWSSFLSSNVEDHVASLRAEMQF
jgi:uncharacterized protein YhjY with autotransporter beta-barrel domain